MGNYVPAVTLDPIEFDGDQVVFVVNRLKTKHMQVLAPYIDKERGVVSFENAAQICSAAESVLPECINSIGGMKHPDGREWTREEFVAVLGEFYFSPLVGVLLAKLIEASTVRANAAKN